MNSDFYDDQEEMEYYGKVYREYINLSEKEAATSSKWLRHLLLTVSTLIGILVSLNPLQLSTPAHIKCCFAVTIFLMTLSLLCGFASLYREVYKMRRYKNAYRTNTIEAARDRKRLEPPSIEEKRCFAVLEVATYILFGLSFLSLSVYVLLSLFVG